MPKNSHTHTCTHTHTHTHTHTPASTSGSLPSKPGIAVMHWMGLAQTGNVSSTSPTAAASRMLTWGGREEGEGGREEGGRREGGREGGRVIFSY